jgi:glycosyltransferase involved in cell wall biosynthesis
MNQPLLHVMIPVYGESPYLEQTLTSILENLPRNIPVTIVEDPSDSKKVLVIIKKFIDRVSYVINPDRLGVSGNFNKCAELSSGVYTQIIGSDDLFLSNPELLMIDKIKEGNSPVAFIPKAKVIHDTSFMSPADIFKAAIKPKIYRDRKVLVSSFAKTILIGDWPYFPSIIWSTKFLLENPFSSKFESAMDLDLFVRMIGSNETLYYLNTFTISYRRHKESQSTVLLQTGKRFLEEFECHKKAIQISARKGLKTEKLFANVAVSVRLHTFYKAIMLINKNPQKAKELIKLSLSKIK